MAQLRGAVEMSIGFIVVIVIAVVMLSLVLSWLRGMFTGIEDLTGQMRQTALSDLTESFQTGASGNFDISPKSYTTTSGKKLFIGVGILNDAEDRKQHNFVINVDVVQQPTGVTSATVQSWIDWVKVPTPIAPMFKNIDNPIPIYINLPSGAIPGIYTLRITACYDKIVGQALTWETCKPGADNMWGGTVRYFQLEVK
ncbi:MAG: hypothetical protein QW703_01700 [Candidatus Aenigmatarchaeota archaeon]